MFLAGDYSNEMLKTSRTTDAPMITTQITASSQGTAAVGGRGAAEADSFGGSLIETCNGREDSLGTLDGAVL